MSLYDESFPDDELLGEVHFSPDSERFPYRGQQRHRHQQRPNLNVCQQTQSAANTSSSSSDRQDLSTQSNDGDHRPSSVLSSKTTASDPDGLNTKRDSEYISPSRHEKAVSYQDLHSEYTKRRYQHVESKVGKYIANLRAEDEKRRTSKKFQWHSSLPETLSEMDSKAGGNDCGDTGGYSNLHQKTQSNDSLHIIDNSDKTEIAATGATAVLTKYEETIGQLLNEKQNLQTLNDYLQSNLHEKMAEATRLKRNVDHMRIELSNAKDKIKRTTQQSGRSAGRSGMNSYSPRLSLPMLVYQQPKTSTATQTDLSPTTECRNDLISSPLVVDKNNNSQISKSNIATIQPFPLNCKETAMDNMRRRSDSNLFEMNGGAHCRCNSSSFIGNCSSSTASTNILDTSHRNETAIIETSPFGRERQILYPPNSRHHKTVRREEFVIYEKQSGRYAINDGEIFYEETATRRGVENLAPAAVKKSKKQQRFKRKWKWILGPCTKCSDNQELTWEQYTQLPLLDSSVSTTTTTMMPHGAAPVRQSLR